MISNQFDFLPLTYSRLESTPVVTTVHGFSSERIVPVYRAYDDIAHYVAISDADRHPALTYAATIHHGIDLSAFTPGAARGGYLLFLGRIHPDKGTHRDRGGPAGRAAAGHRGIVQDEAYFRDAGPAPRGRRRRSATPARSARPSGTGCWAARSPCCISSTSTSRSGSRSSSRWPSGRR